ncbi:cation exporting V-type ATPase, subunit B [Paracholeplasma brassicae]|uniref:V-type ATP synthase beta chain n=1 Tax=Acholeplasma brassicae TaxID=61635 RepID=U4KMX0_9MOLU|nr:V-type ATP synthase subunit B [Paracholeplasma brassicae]CCV65602.1 cation exporting V-type ATPase, subunit B [Paracholeplasma brassicae]HBT59464.1 V-type ATP synthase subunit B [Acholeplasmataceae bacterium]
MNLQYIGLDEINGPLVFLDGVKGVGFEEMVEIRLQNGGKRYGRVVQIEGEKVAIQVFEGTHDLSLTNTKTKFTGHPVEAMLSKEILGRTFNGSGYPIDGLGDVFVDEKRDINGIPLNPVSRIYPRDYIQTGVSSIDSLTTLIRGQKLPIFSGSGMPHNELAVQIVKQAKIHESKGDDFCVIFAAMGVKNDVADYFRRSFEEAGVMSKVVMYLNLSNEPIIERILTPRFALTAAEYLAYKHDMHVLVILTDITAYCEALREFSSSKGEIPGRKGYPGYLYSDLASLYERAGIVKKDGGSVTQIPILTMPNDDITHPVPDLTGYITEGQIVLSRDLNQVGIFPPVGILPSLSRLMKDGIGAGYTREDHQSVANQLFASYAMVQDARSLASVIGEDELSSIDKMYMDFGKLFEKYFIGQGFETNRSIIDTLDLGWDLLSVLPKEELNRIDDKLISAYYNHERAVERFHIHNKPIIKTLAGDARYE